MIHFHKARFVTRTVYISVMEINSDNICPNLIEIYALRQPYLDLNLN